MSKTTSRAISPNVEEVLFRSDNVFLCMLVNRSMQCMRVIDFRAGALPAKRLCVDSIARKEGVAKVLTFVEKDEVSTWTKIGFTREGTVPGFYKRSDGYLCGYSVQPTDHEKTAEANTSRAEQTINHAKKAAKELGLKPNKKLQFQWLSAEEAQALCNKARKSEGILPTFENFGRDAERIYLHSQVKNSKGKGLLLSAEFQDWFGHALVELQLRPNAQDAEIAHLANTLLHLNETLCDKKIVSAFAFAPSDDKALATAYTAAGYRKTGLLARAIPRDKEQVDAILWSRKLANPVADEED